MVLNVPVLVASVYGYPTGGAHHDPLARTDSLLETYTKEIVLGRKGVRVICGDYNHSEGSLEQLSLWRQAGWVEAQTLALSRWQQVEQHTCKYATKRDFLYLSPEAAAACASVTVRHDFAEHATVIASLGLQVLLEPVQRWPQPSELPWDEVAVDAWHHVGHHPPTNFRSPTQWMQDFSVGFERSLNGFLPGRPGHLVPSSCCGRSARLHPTAQIATPVVVKPSRPGEEALRHDFLSRELKRWFSQLRRLQSLHHSLQANKQHADACIYRASLWHAIRGAKGFKGGFPGWWSGRPIQHQGSPLSLPIGLPSASCVHSLFLDFRDNFRKFESWCIRKRSQVLCDKYKSSVSLLYQELRSPPAPQVDTIQVNNTHAILAVEPDANLAHLDPPADFRGYSTWHLDGTPVQVAQVTAEVCRVEGEVELVEDAELVQTQILASSCEVQQEFVSLWKSRWQKHQGLGPEDWTRVLDFSRHYMPRGCLDLAPISVSQWLRQVRRYKPRAARGPDGWSKLDLLHTPRPKIQELLAVLHRIESGEVAWPEQLLVGFVIALAKANNRLDVQGFRPICLFSIIYRTWSGIRAGQLLQWMSGFLDPDTMGFLPRRTATDMWMLIQSDLGLCLQGQAPSVGFCSDVVKAFNNLPRLPLLDLAEQLGFPQCVLVPWRGFLGGVARRFQIRDSLSAGLLSTSGFPEGDPMSPIAMLLANSLFHRYMRAFAGNVRALSYADNYSGVGRSGLAVMQSLSAAQACCDLLDLELDAGKTYVWATDATQRKLLQQCGLQVRMRTRELGGIFSFGKAVRNAELKKRCAALQPPWQLLAKSKSPYALKLGAVVGKCWAQALHGTAACSLGNAQVDSLRTAAVRALNARLSGSSPMLRLSLSHRMDADPGFYMLWSSFREFRRVLRSQPGMLQDWRAFCRLFDGRTFQGPFSLLWQHFQTLRWEILEAPVVVDHEGFCHDFGSAPLSLLRLRAEHAWLQHVARQHQHRRTMCDLIGIEPSLARLDAQKLPPRDAARVAALHSGAFILPYQHARFDATKPRTCGLCGMLDDHRHRVCQCPRFAAARAEHPITTEQWDELPMCLTHHLLPPRDPLMLEFRRHLCQVVDVTGEHWPTPPALGRQHLFTDGTCTQDASEVNFAAWSVVNATSGTVVSAGPLPGLLQTTPRAELTAMLSALQSATSISCPVILWIDALHAAQGIHRLLEHQDASWAIANTDLWCSVADRVVQLGDRLTVQHVPSHVDRRLCEGPFEEWASAWNAHADTVAGVANFSRPLAFLDSACRGYSSLAIHVQPHCRLGTVPGSA